MNDPGVCYTSCSLRTMPPNMSRIICYPDPFLATLPTHYKNHVFLSHQIASLFHKDNAHFVKCIFDLERYGCGATTVILLLYLFHYELFLMGTWK